MFRKKNLYPVKTTLNLVIKDRPPYYYQTIVLGLLVGIVAIGAFTKLAVIDVLNAARERELQAKSTRASYEQLMKDNAIYSEMRLEHEKYFKAVNDGEDIADCMDVLGLIEKSLMTKAAVQAAALSDNKLSVVLTGIDLEQASAVVKELYLSNLVSTVSLSSADTTLEDSYSSISMNISLVSEGGIGE